MMLGIYVAVASLSVIIVIFLVDNLPKHFADIDANEADSSEGKVISYYLYIFYTL